MSDTEDFDDGADEPEGTLPHEWMGMRVYSIFFHGALRAMVEMVREIAPDRLDEAEDRAIRAALDAMSMTFAGGSVVGDDETPPSYIKGGNAALGTIAHLFADLRR